LEVMKAFDLEAEIKSDMSKPSGMQRKLLNVERARSLGWKPKTSLNAGLKSTIEWYLRQEGIKHEA